MQAIQKSREQDASSLHPRIVAYGYLAGPVVSSNNCHTRSVKIIPASRSLGVID